ncbi:MAG TPA: transporter substrate-binding domain-containing protein, partial [Candidatus Babeliales bacterium]|nr:transporter substrate-binding domain-containing protein [Candidatus Babeliales bacterium]
SLTSGRAFAFVTAGSVIKPFFDKYGKSRFNIFKIMGVSDSYSLSVSKKFPELLTQIQRLLDDMERDGTLVRLKQKWGVTTEWLI